MADDERRAEIEALIPWVHWQGGMRGTHNCDFEVCQIEPCPRLRAILDRVRDARGDDEATYPPDRMTAGEAPRPAEWKAWQARSPQGEDHEASQSKAVAASIGPGCDCSTQFATWADMSVPTNHRAMCPVRQRLELPQAEDDEAGDFDEQAITDILVGIDEVLESHGRERMDIIDGPTVDALRDVVKRELVAFLSRATDKA